MKKLKPLAYLLLLLGSLSAQNNYSIYVCDAGNFANPNYQILRFDADGDNGEVFIDQQLAWPQDLIFLEDENIVLVSNLNSGLINKHDATTGQYLNVFASGLGGPTRMKIRNDTLYVLQWVGDLKVLRFNLDGENLGPATATGVGRSIGIDWDNENKLYVSSYGGPSIPVEVRQYDTDGSDLGSFIGSDNLQGPTNIWFDTDGSGDLLVVDYNGGAVQRFNSIGEHQGVFISSLQTPEGVDFLPNGNILIGNGGTGAVKMFTPSGAFIEDLIASGSSGLVTPNAIVIRTNESVGIEDIVENQAIVYPTIGRHFFLDSTFSSSIQTLEIFDASGRKVFSSTPNGTELWNAHTFPQGIYFLFATIKEGQIVKQKLIVE